MQKTRFSHDAAPITLSHLHSKNWSKSFKGVQLIGFNGHFFSQIKTVRIIVAMSDLVHDVENVCGLW